MTHTQTQKDINLLRVNCDSNGNSRFVLHFLNLVNDQDKEEAKRLSNICSPFNFPTHYEYEIAVNKARKIGGKKYTAKHYGGGIVFQKNSEYQLKEDILNLLKEEGTKKFKASFVGRLVGAIGKVYKINETIEAINEQEAENKLYNKYEHITNLIIK